MTNVTGMAVGHGGSRRVSPRGPFIVVVVVRGPRRRRAALCDLANRIARESLILPDCPDCQDWHRDPNEEDRDGCIVARERAIRRDRERLGATVVAIAVINIQTGETWRDPRWL